MITRQRNSEDIKEAINRLAARRKHINKLVGITMAGLVELKDAEDYPRLSVIVCEEMMRLSAQTDEVKEEISPDRFDYQLYGLSKAMYSFGSLNSEEAGNIIELSRLLNPCGELESQVMRDLNMNMKDGTKDIISLDSGFMAIELLKRMHRWQRMENFTIHHPGKTIDSIVVNSIVKHYSCRGYSISAGKCFVQAKKEGEVLLALFSKDPWHDVTRVTLSQCCTIRQIAA